MNIQISPNTIGTYKLISTDKNGNHLFFCEEYGWTSCYNPYYPTYYSYEDVLKVKAFLESDSPYTIQKEGREFFLYNRITRRYYTGMNGESEDKNSRYLYDLFIDAVKDVLTLVETKTPLYSFIKEDNLNFAKRLASVSTKEYKEELKKLYQEIMLSSEDAASFYIEAAFYLKEVNND